MTSEERTLLPLRYIPPSELDKLPLPSRKIKTEEDVHAWKLTTGYQDYGLFLRRLNESVVGHFLPWSSPVTYPVSFLISNPLTAFSS